MFYINYYGCDGYSGGLYVMNETEITSTLAGAPLLCDNPMKQRWLSLAYFVSFIFICSFSMLSLFVGAITVSMSESMETMRAEKLQQKKKKRLQEAEKKLKKSIKASDESGGGEEKKEVKKHSMQQRRAWRLVSAAFKDGGKIESALEEEESTDFILVRWYRKLAIEMRNLTEESYFQNFVTCVIIAAGVQVGMNTDAELSVSLGKELYWTDYIIRIIFTIECGMKLIAEEFQPWTYFESNWNVFDFIVVVGSYVSGGGSLIVMLRLLRLLRVLKLMRMLPQLQVIVTALMSGFSSITFISIILFLFFYFFGIIAMILFSKNDPLHFGNLHITMIALFQCSTLDNWSDLLYINLYGCDVFGYDEIPEQCTQPQPAFITTSLYFIVFILMGALVLLTLFIGVVATSMEEATEEQKSKANVDVQAAKVAKEHGLKFTTVCLYREVFSALDLNGGNMIDANELRLGLTAAGRDDISDKQFSRLWRSVDQDNSGGIDFSEFLLFMVALRENKYNNHDKEVETEQPPATIVAKLKRPLSAPRQLFRRVHDSVQSTLSALRLQHGHPVLPESKIDDTISKVVPQRSNSGQYDNGDGAKPEKECTLKTNGAGQDTCLDSAVQKNSGVSGRNWPASTEFSRDQVVPSRKSQNLSKERYMSKDRYFEVPQESDMADGDERVNDAKYTKRIRSYEDRKRVYTPSKDVSLQDHRSFLLDSPYGTSRLSPALKGGSVSNKNNNGQRKQVVSKACFI